MRTTRRTFLTGVGRTALACGLTPTLLSKPAFAALATVRPDGEPLDFGALEPLVALLQETEADALLPLLVRELQSGTGLDTLVAAGALANARTFGGGDYEGYHALMALMPAWSMSLELPDTRRALPVLKVLYRNTARIRRVGGRTDEALRTVAMDAADASSAELVQAYRNRDLAAADRTVSALAHQSPGAAQDALQLILPERLDVHRVVLAWRSWEILELVGEEHAETMLRQPARFCVDWEERAAERGEGEPPLRTLLPALIEERDLAAGALGTRRAEPADLESFGVAICEAERAAGAEIAADLLAEGLDPGDVGEALTLAANRLLLHDPGRPRADGPGKPAGSVHGASVGVHASDAARAWRNLAGAADGRHAVTCLIAGAYHTAGQSQRVGREPLPWREVELGSSSSPDSSELLNAVDEAVRARDQTRAAAAAGRLVESGAAIEPLFALLLDHALEADGALHAEKYYRTVREDAGDGHPSFRARHLAALARVTASEFGWEAPGYAEACELLKA